MAIKIAVEPKKEGLAEIIKNNIRLLKTIFRPIKSNFVFLTIVSKCPVN